MFQHLLERESSDLQLNCFRQELGNSNCMIMENVVISSDGLETLKNHLIECEIQLESLGNELKNCQEGKCTCWLAMSHVFAKKAREKSSKLKSNDLEDEWSSLTTSNDNTHSSALTSTRCMMQLGSKLNDRPDRHPWIIMMKWMHSGVIMWL